MTKHVKVEIPEDWLDEQGVLPTATINEIFCLGLEQQKIERTLAI